MAVSDADKIDFLFKKIGFVAAKTGAATFAAASEPESSPLVVPNRSIWNQSDDIEYNNPPAETNAVVRNYIGLEALQLTVDPRITSNKTWICTAVHGDLSTRLTNWIDPGNFGASFLVQIFKGGQDAANGGTKLPITGVNNDGWFFDYASGILNFNDQSLPAGVDANTTLYINGYRYIGTTGAGGGSASITVSDVAPEAPEVGAMWWNSVTGDLLIYYDDQNSPLPGLPSTQWVSVIGGVGGFFTLNPATNTISTPYNLTALSKQFRITHPLPSLASDYDLIHTSVESPKADLIYRGKTKCVNGKVEINIDIESDMTEGTFEVLCDNPSCFVTNETNWTSVKGSIQGNILTIESKESDLDLEVSWLVVATRKDPGIFNMPHVNESGEFTPEVLRDNLDAEKESLPPITISGFKSSQ